MAISRKTIVFNSLFKPTWVLNVGAILKQKKIVIFNTERKKERENDRKKERNCDSERDRETERQRDKHRDIDGKKNRKSERQKDRKTERQKDKCYLLELLLSRM